MDKNHVFLMSVYNDIEAENVVGILEMEGIKAEISTPGRGESAGKYIKGKLYADIYVPDHSVENAREIIETEMVRGDF